MPRAFLVKKKRCPSRHIPKPHCDQEYPETIGLKFTDHPPQYYRVTPGGRKEETVRTDLNAYTCKAYFVTSHDETPPSDLSHLSQNSHRRNVAEVPEPVDLSRTKPIFRASSSSAFEYVEPSVRAPPARLNNRILKPNPNADKPLDLQVRLATSQDLSLSFITDVGSAPTRPAALYNSYASYQNGLGPNRTPAFYPYTVPGTASTRASPFRSAPYYRYSDWNHGRSDRNTTRFAKEEKMVCQPPNPTPTAKDSYPAPPSFCPVDYAQPTHTQKYNVEEIQPEQQSALNLSPSKWEQLEVSVQLPRSDRLEFSRLDLSRRAKNQGHALKHSARPPIPGLEYIQNLPSTRDSNRPAEESGQLSESQEQAADTGMRLEKASNSSEQRYTRHAGTETTPASDVKTLPVDKPSQCKKYVCDVCGKGFSRSNTLVTHKRIHTGAKPFECELCGRAFRQPGNLTRHRLTHTTVKPYVCQQCGKAFNRASNLHTHMRTHTNYKPYTCQYCGKGFHQKIDMKIHSYTHTGEKPHKCKTCGRGFKQLTHLTYHMRTHSDIKMYTCAYCGKGFNQKGNLQAHIYGHTGERPYHCDVCSKGFTLASTLNTHRRTHAEKKPNTCQYCGKDFYQKTALKHHMIASHPHAGKSMQ